MTIWILIDEHTSIPQVVGAYSTEELAEKAKQKYDEFQVYTSRYTTHIHEVTLTVE